MSKRRSAVWAGIVLLGLAGTPAAGLVISGGPVYSLPGGGSCSVSGSPALASGATVTCTGVNLGAHTQVYFGIKNNTSPNGNTMTGAQPSGSAVFNYSSNTSTAITYVSTTTVNNILGSSSQAVSNQMIITRTGGATTIVSTGGNPANNSNGQIERLFRLDSGTSFTFTVQVLSSTTGISGFGISNPHVYNPIHTPSSGSSDVSRVDLGFYYSSCGDGTPDGSEQCDTGAANGTAASCCTTSCTFKPNGTGCTDDGNVCTLDVCNGSSAVCQHPAGNAGLTCRAAAGVCDIGETCTGASTVCPGDAKSTAVCRAAAGVCDLAESCNGVSNNCPADAKSTAVCRGAAGACDLAESCNGSGNNCPADLKSTAVCRAAAGICDIAESCDGVSDTCPTDAKSTATCRAVAGACDVAEVCDGVSNTCGADVVLPDTVVCNPGSGDLCDPDETCTGASPTCPTDVIASNSTVCRAGSGDVCDPDETCTGVADAPCPADVVAPASTVCRPGVDACDAADHCTGNAGEACPADLKEPSSTVCRAAAHSCDVAEQCDGSSDACPADVLAADDTPCPDGLFCNGEETCQAGVCTDQANPCIVQGICSEAADQCQTDTCPPVKLSGCRTAVKSLLIIKNKADNTKDKLIWKFIKGQPTTQGDFSDPTLSADYALCVYAGSTSALVAETAIPAGAKWTVLSTKGYKYKDPSLTPDGVQNVVLSGTGISGKTKALVKARGVNLVDPIDADALDNPVTAQLINYQNGKCWQGTYNSAKKSTTTLYKGKQ